MNTENYGWFILILLYTDVICNCYKLGHTHSIISYYTRCNVLYTKIDSTRRIGLALCDSQGGEAYSKRPFLKVK